MSETNRLAIALAVREASAAETAYGEALRHQSVPSPVGGTEREGKAWVCMTCGFIGDRQSCGNCGAESRPVSVPSPVGGTEPDTAKALLESTKAEAACGRELAAAHRRIAELETAVSGTEPDTAKLIVAAIADLEAGFAAQWPSGKRPRCDEGWLFFATALDHLRDIERAGFSVDAGNPRPEQPAPDRLGGQPPSEPKEER